MGIAWLLTAQIGGKEAEKTYPSWLAASEAIDLIATKLPSSDRARVSVSVKGGSVKGLHHWIERGEGWRLSVQRLPDNDRFDGHTGGPLLADDPTCP